MPTLDHEKSLRASGFRIVAGIDEAGRGPLAGPVCVAAVILPDDFTHSVLNDSKQLNEAKRERLYEEIMADDRIHWHCVSIEPDEIDRINILRATWEGMRRAALGLIPRPDAALIDGKPVKQFPMHQVALVKGDSLSYSIAAASIIAKVTRDRLMVAMAEQHPEYGFEIHKGYPTPAHLAALKRHGPCAHHRRSFGPVAQLELDLA
ncbi:ribonuclease HII [Prosthecobacter sp.]|uniref:ribonuclease HII n=1 Tax=Prosthecobacter sp. TaxID=1965333 RepID=UPI001D5A4B0F|nr:ribonuclease HII [Prosthecobacter sp.]MCB1277321.1 ribonuclease HII [Prosthecobacter sp.]